MGPERHALLPGSLDAERTGLGHALLGEPEAPPDGLARPAPPAAGPGAGGEVTPGDIPRGARRRGPDVRPLRPGPRRVVAEVGPVGGTAVAARNPDERVGEGPGRARETVAGGVVSVVGDTGLRQAIRRGDLREPRARPGESPCGPAVR